MATKKKPKFEEIPAWGKAKKPKIREISRKANAKYLGAEGPKKTSPVKKRGK